MTENKRFTSQRTDDYNFSDILDDGNWVGICHVDCEDDFVNLLNELAEENQHLLKHLDMVREHRDELIVKNKELQERNNRQAKQLDSIYQLIEQRDWRALSDIMDDFQKAEEQLQKEWSTYGDV